MKTSCEVCGTEFVSYNPNPRFCTTECKVRSQVADVDHEAIARLYRNGLSQSEVAVEIGCSQKVVFKSLKRQGVKARPAVKRDQRGARNDSWKGDDAGYQAFHRRIDALRGKPMNCEECGTSSPARIYDWANLTGRYNDPSDFKRMCRTCHRKYDNKRHREGADANA